MPAAEECALRTGDTRCGTCGARKPYNPFATPAAANRLWARQEALLPDDDGPVTRQRGWHVWAVGETASGPRLIAPFRLINPDPEHPAAVWTPGINEASTVKCWAGACRTEVHPSPNCGCGFRAMTSLGALLAFADRQRATRSRPAIAEVAMFGRVVGPAPGDDWPRTLRASHAYIIGNLYVADPDQFAALSQHYGVECRPIEELVA